MSRTGAPRIGPFGDVAPRSRMAGLANVTHSGQTAVSEMINRKGSVSG